MSRPKLLWWWCGGFLALTALCQIAVYTILEPSPETILWIRNSTNRNSEQVIVLWWTPFMTKERIKVCGEVECLVTSNRSYLTHTDLKALLFYGSSLDKSDVPLRGSALWGLFHEESPRNVPFLSHAPTLSLFNYSATFSRASHLPLTLQFLPSLDDLISGKFVKSFEEKQIYRKTLGPVFYLQSDCSTPNNRDSYVAELMNNIKVDSYGACLNNQQLSSRSICENLSFFGLAGSICVQAAFQNAPETMMSELLMELVSRYKFSIAIENAICDDYITEKLWRPLIAGSIPLYVGSPTAKDWLPNNRSAIFPLDFKSPKELAEYLLYLDGNKAAYESYMHHKLQGSIANKKLREEYKTLWPADSLGVVDEFECLLCKKTQSPESNSVDKSHYNCPEPYSILTKTRNESNWWYWYYLDSKVEATAFRKQVLENIRPDEKLELEKKTLRR